MVFTDKITLYLLSLTSQQKAELIIGFFSDAKALTFTLYCGDDEVNEAIFAKFEDSKEQYANYSKALSIDERKENLFMIHLAAREDALAQYAGSTLMHSGFYNATCFRFDFDQVKHLKSTGNPIVALRFAAAFGQGAVAVSEILATMFDSDEARVRALLSTDKEGNNILALAIKSKLKPIVSIIIKTLADLMPAEEVSVMLISLAPEHALALSICSGSQEVFEAVLTKKEASTLTTKTDYISDRVFWLAARTGNVEFFGYFKNRLNEILSAEASKQLLDRETRGERNLLYDAFPKPAMLEAILDTLSENYPNTYIVSLLIQEHCPPFNFTALSRALFASDFPQQLKDKVLTKLCEALLASDPDEGQAVLGFLKDQVVTYPELALLLLRNLDEIISKEQTENYPKFKSAK